MKRNPTKTLNGVSHPSSVRKIRGDIYVLENSSAFPFLMFYFKNLYAVMLDCVNEVNPF